MKHQKVSVDVWAMVQTMLGYLAVVVFGGLLLRLMVAAFTLPSRLRKQRDNVEAAMLKLKERYPDAFKEAEEMVNDPEKEKKALEEMENSILHNEENEDQEEVEESKSEDMKKTD